VVSKKKWVFFIGCAVLVGVLFQATYKQNKDIMVPETYTDAFLRPQTQTVYQTYGPPIAELKTVRDYVEQGVEYGLIGELNEAIKEFKRAVKLDPSFVPAYLNLGNTYMNLGEVDQAIIAYSTAIKVEPGWESSIAYLNLGAVYANVKQDYVKAVQYLQKYVDLNPHSHEAYKLEDQIEMLHKIIELEGAVRALNTEGS
jgi:tetratricopeptide (TPR) repeat protein